jgi:hypothetical protein
LPPAGFDRPQCLQTAPEIEANNNIIFIKSNNSF